MAAKPKEYQRLRGQGVRRQGFLSVSVTARRVRLYLGRDHLLSVESQWFTEDYRRFYFRDIQSIIVRKTTNGRVTNLVLGVLALATGSAALITTEGFRIFWTILASVCAFFLLLNAIGGPTCVCHLRTAVQMDEMPSLRRLWRARKIMKRLRSFIAEAQGTLAPEEISARMAQMEATPVATATANSSPALVASPVPISEPPPAEAPPPG